MKWKIGNVEIENQLVLAPMAGITNESFRSICKEMGAGLVVCEMISDKALSFHNAKTIKMTGVSKFLVRVKRLLYTQLNGFMKILMRISLILIWAVLLIRLLKEQVQALPY